MNKFFELVSVQTMGRVLMLAAFCSFSYWYFIYDDGSALDRQINDVTNQLQAEEAKKKDTDATLKQVQEMQEKVGLLSQKYEEIAKRLPAALFSIDINKAIDDFARTSTVSVKSKKPSVNVRREVVEEVPVEVTLEGTYAQLGQFIYTVSTAERMARTVNIVVTPIEPGSKQLRLNGTVVGYKLAPQKVETKQ